MERREGQAGREGRQQVAWGRPSPGPCRHTRARLWSLPNPKQEACMGGELFDMVIERKHFTEADAASITAAMLSVMQHCHSKGIIHRGGSRAVPP